MTLQMMIFAVTGKNMMRKILIRGKQYQNLLVSKLYRKYKKYKYTS